MYGFVTTLTGITFNDALGRTTAALKGEGFGVLSDIDVQRAMREELGAASRQSSMSAPFSADAPSPHLASRRPACRFSKCQ